jgi:hypothetical protein
VKYCWIFGTAHLVSFFDADNGEKWLTRAAELFDNVQQFDKDLKDFELPESVRKVSQPPKEERYKDRWTNIKLSQQEPGQFLTAEVVHGTGIPNEKMLQSYKV